jgi:hypothetical protein
VGQRYEVRDMAICGNGGIVMKVFVIMGNDFPECVFRDEFAANQFVERKKREENDTVLGYRTVYWKVYPFDLKESAS